MNDVFIYLYRFKNLTPNDQATNTFFTVFYWVF